MHIELCSPLTILLFNYDSPGFGAGWIFSFTSHSINIKLCLTGLLQIITVFEPHEVFLQVCRANLKCYHQKIRKIEEPVLIWDYSRSCSQRSPKQVKNPNPHGKKKKKKLCTGWESMQLKICTSICEKIYGGEIRQCLECAKKIPHFLTTCMCLGHVPS